MQYNINGEEVQATFQAIPQKMRFSKSINQYLAQSLFNMAKYQNREFLNILITDTQFLQLIGKAQKISHIGITGLNNQEKYLASLYLTDRALIVKQDISNSYIDVIISNKKELTQKILKNNFVKYIYAFHDLNQTQIYKKYNSSIEDCYLFINRLSPKNFQNKEVQKIEQRIIQKKEKPKEIIIQKKEIIQTLDSNYQFIKNTVSFIIPFYNNIDYSIKFIKMVQKHTIDSKYKIQFIFINDGSNEKSTLSFNEKVKEFSKFNVNIIANQQRLGYIKSTNLGIKKALQDKQEFIILAHNDSQVSYNWQEILNNLQGNIAANCPLAGSKVDGNQTVSYIRQNNILQNFPQSFQKCKTLDINKKLEIYKGYSKQIDYSPSFFFIAFQGKVFNDLGLLNQNFKDGFGESIEYYYRCLNKNYKFNLIPQVYIQHDGSITYREIYPDKSFIQQSKARYYLNEIREKLNYKKQKDKVIYTCITNNYDFPNHSFYNHEDFDYIYFGQKDPNNQNWIFIDINKLIPALGVKDPIKIARFFKTHPHLFFKNYQTSLWIDGNIDIIDDPIDMVDLLYEEDFMMISKHPERDSVYSQAQVCKSMNKDTIQNIDNLIQYINKNGFKDSTGLVQSGLIIRKHKVKDCIQLMQMWWKMIKEFSCRDQLSFNYCLQKLNSKVVMIDWDIFQNKYIKWNGKHGNK